jgi:seryl-tRNA synthetase
MLFLSKEIETKLEEATHYNKEIRAERDRLKERLKQAEENLAHQVKVTKNLELVLERIQNGTYKYNFWYFWVS